ncbi:hypothetical protein GGR51DRAFT_543093 [Nemania sp. FL0031]|nr:hypothetical protein GGR51DRAFT_543093 [Nemania sp. FL0031]
MAWSQPIIKRYLNLTLFLNLRAVIVSVTTCSTYISSMTSSMELKGRIIARTDLCLLVTGLSSGCRPVNPRSHLRREGCSSLTDLAGQPLLPQRARGHVESINSVKKGVAGATRNDRPIATADMDSRGMKQKKLGWYYEQLADARLGLPRRTANPSFDRSSE